MSHFYIFVCLLGAIHAAFLSPDGTRLKPMVKEKTTTTQLHDHKRRSKVPTANGGILDIPVIMGSVSPSLMDRYDIWLLDQFGVLHDGTKPLEGSVDIVQELLNRKKKVIITSNTSQRAVAASRRFRELGFPEVHGFITSGEFCWHHLKRKYATKKAIIFSWKGEKLGASQYLDGTGVVMTDDVEEAEVLIFHGSETMGASNQIISLRDTGNVEPDVHAVLKRAAEKGLIAVCANQDKVALWADGQPHYMPGILEEAYREQYGGVTEFFGKPDLQFFNAALALAQHDGDSAGDYESFGDGLPCHVPETLRTRRAALARCSPVVRAVHVGDSLEHDVNGANNAGLDVLFVTKHGVHRHELHNAPEEEDGGADPARLLRAVCGLCDSQKVHRPSHVVESFRIGK
jgi:HAD superfamily hydrolase (TIGR01459 family)